ncbi:MAG: lysophospholipid acyltransferase family protein [Anaerolineales bacterium]|nr:lysophospholipid acyltransferase family protein [Anaerolineales bacterium]
MIPNSQLQHDGPALGKLPYAIGWLWLKVTGWRVAGSIPAGSKFVVIAAPHTSNWDFPFMLAVAAVYRLRLSWMGKHSLFKPPFGRLMRRLGGIPIYRDTQGGLVEQVVARFAQNGKLVVLVPPSGTRQKRDYWKSGFYWIAYNAQVPLLCAYLDFARKEAGLGLSFVPTGDLSADMDRIREFYAGKAGKFPDQHTTIRLRDEDNPEAVRQAPTASS